MFQSTFVRAVSALTLSLLVSCGRTDTPTSAHSRPEVLAASLISQSFSASKDPKTGRPTLVLHKTALDKEFLLQGAVISQPVAAMGESIRSRIVAFKQQGDQVFMLEATQGHTVTYDLPQNLVLAAFPVVSESPTELNIDFNAGMSAIFTDSDWTGHSDTPEYSPTVSAAKIRLSYLEDIKFVPQEKVVIRQIAQVLSSGFLRGDSADVVEVRYFLSPYRPSATFVPSKDADFKRVGFFEVTPKLKLDGSADAFSTKFDSTKPIIFAVSANTPAEYRQAVKDGILYWKGVLPSLSAIDGPAGVTAPDVDHNVIQWVNFDRAGSAYADAQMDPRTGEILRGQAFITSTFAFGTKRKLRSLLRRLEATPTPTAPVKRIGLMGFASGRLCERNAEETLQRSLTALNASGASEAKILRVAQDFVRAVVAHEVGHLMGLRHNFAGSLDTKLFDLKDREKIYHAYLENDSVAPGLETASTEMDYLPLEESAIHGQQMRMVPGSLYSYDRIAMEMLYFGKQPAAKDVPTFCTDDEVGKFKDCQRFDFGTNLVEYSAASARQSMKDLAHAVMETFLSAKAPAPWEKVRAIDTVNIDIKKIVSSLVGPLSTLVENLDPKSESLKITRLFPFVGSLNKELVEKKERDAIEASVQAWGGWETVLATPTFSDFDVFLDKITELSASPEYLSGEGPTGAPYSLSPEEVRTILDYSLEMAVQIPPLVLSAEIAMLGKIPEKWKVTFTQAGDALATHGLKRAQFAILEKSPEAIETELDVPAPPAPVSVVDPAALWPNPTAAATAPAATTAMQKVKVALPVFRFNHDTRLKAAALLKSPNDLDGADWGKAERATLKGELKAALDKACGCDVEKLDLDKLSLTDLALKKRVSRWFVENRKLLTDLR
jgi:hypothetical protein